MINYPTYEECVAKFPKKKAQPFELSEDGKMLFGISPKIKGALIVPEGVEIVRLGALKASGLTDIVMPDSVRELRGWTVGDYCEKLAFVRLSPNMTLSNKCFYSTKMEGIVIPEGIEYIPIRAFEHSKLKHVELPSTLKYICANAFHNTKLEEVVIPASVKVILPGAFNTATLQKVTFESKDTKVMAGAFHEDFPKQELEGREITTETYGLDEVVYEEENGKRQLASLPAYFVGPLAIEEGAGVKRQLDLREYPGITELTIPDSIKDIPYLPHYLRKLTLPDHVTRLDLADQTQLMEFNWPASATSLNISESLMSELEIPEGIEDIDIFEMPNLVKLVIPASVTYLAERAVQWCPNLSEVIIKGTPEIEDEAFYECPNYKG